MAEPQSLAGKVAIVTGGTQGLGQSIAQLLVARGVAGIVIAGRNARRGAAVAQALKEGGSEALFVEAELADLDAARGVVEACERQFGRVDVLVNAAAITDRGTILDTSPELFDLMFAVNVRAPFFLIQDAARVMRRTGRGGSIVNILSMSGHGGQPFLAAYSASKTALAGLTRNAAFALMPDRIRINGLNIGWMDSPGEHAIQARAHGAGPGWLAEAEARMPFGRLLKPEEVARAVAFLASDESGLMTGALIDFDQGVLGAGDPPRPAERLPG